MLTDSNSLQSEAIRFHPAFYCVLFCSSASVYTLASHTIAASSCCRLTSSLCTPKPLCNIALTLESVTEIVKFDHSNESYWAALSRGAVYYAVQGDSNFCGVSS